MRKPRDYKQEYRRRQLRQGEKFRQAVQSAIASDAILAFVANGNALMRVIQKRQVDEMMVGIVAEKSGPDVMPIRVTPELRAAFEEAVKEVGDRAE